MLMILVSKQSTLVKEVGHQIKIHHGRYVLAGLILRLPAVELDARLDPSECCFTVVFDISSPASSPSLP